MDGWMDGCMYVCMYTCLYAFICRYLHAEIDFGRAPLDCHSPVFLASVGGHEHVFGAFGCARVLSASDVFPGGTARILPGSPGLP